MIMTTMVWFARIFKAEEFASFAWRCRPIDFRFLEQQLLMESKLNHCRYNSPFLSFSWIVVLYYYFDVF